MRAARDAGADAIGVEPDPEMAALAASLLGDDVVVAGLPDLPFADDGFDVVVASFVLNHVDDPRAGARELARVAAPGGSLRATIWDIDPPPQALMWNALLDRVGAVRPPSPRLPVDRDFERSADGLAGILSETGLAVTGAGTLSWQWRVAPGDPGPGLTSVGNFGVLWRAQSEDVQDRLRAAYDDLGAPWRDGDDCPSTSRASWPRPASRRS